MDTKPILKIKPAGNDDLLTFADPKDREAFMHFTGGFLAIIKSRLPELETVARLHGWEALEESLLGPWGCLCQTLHYKEDGVGCRICNPEAHG